MAFVRDREAIAKHCGKEFSEPTIGNFHSYSIDPGLRFPGHGKYAVLISASTSGKLARKLVDDHGARPEALHHMLILSSEVGLGSNAMYFEEIPLEATMVGQAFRREISIPGEEFIASSGEAHPARITKKHFAPLESKVLALPCYQKSLKLNLAAPGQSAYSLIALAGGLEGENDFFDKWLADEIEHAIPANVGWILAVDSNESYALATRIAALLAAHVGRGLPVLKLAEFVGVGGKPEDSEGRSVLIVAATTGLAACRT
jgi:hypothetical protein